MYCWLQAPGVVSPALVQATSPAAMTDRVGGSGGGRRGSAERQRHGHDHGELAHGHLESDLGAVGRRPVRAYSRVSRVVRARTAFASAHRRGPAVLAA